MGRGRPLFPGSTVEEEIALITKLLGPLEGPPNPPTAVLEALSVHAPAFKSDALDLLTSFLHVRFNAFVLHLVTSHFLCAVFIVCLN